MSLYINLHYVFFFLFFFFFSSRRRHTRFDCDWSSDVCSSDLAEGAHRRVRACRVIPGGVNSPVRAFRAVGGTPLFIARAAGARSEERRVGKEGGCRCGGGG